MKLEHSILEDVREAVGLNRTVSDFDTDLLMHINSAIGKLHQNGIGTVLVVTDSSATWRDLQDPTQIEGNKYFQMIPMFIVVSTKIIFDPPPPSTVEYYNRSIDESLWRLKVAYENPIVTKTPILD